MSLGYDQTWGGILERFNTHEEKLCVLKKSRDEKIREIKSFLGRNWDFIGKCYG
ncbi:hypothetical protein OIDMADRAFT_19219 [Oidiodendron maius Zn]|uniref:Uncharacterized protein n=1 Tax=Oidiodendron maius (strain Zn) TaxID=913774 RepID=A0A0C3HG47_OIDMZ|nr:hypothetical protein OIDMADRAFT_19219 [Oidiodendron maius Zn]